MTWWFDLRINQIVSVLISHLCTHVFLTYQVICIQKHSHTNQEMFLSFFILTKVSSPPDNTVLYNWVAPLSKMAIQLLLRIALFGTLPGCKQLFVSKPLRPGYFTRGNNHLKKFVKEGAKFTFLRKTEKKDTWPLCHLVYFQCISVINQYQENIIFDSLQ